MASEADRHIVVRWLKGCRQQQAKHLPADHKPGQVFGAPSTGEITELLALAHDLYLLQKVDRLPDSLVNRLRLLPRGQSSFLLQFRVPVHH